MEEVIRDKATGGTFKNKFKLGEKKPPEWKTQEVSSMGRKFFLFSEQFLKLILKFLSTKVLGNNLAILVNQ